jgi:response regulator of citrate/malate metabolism
VIGVLIVEDEPIVRRAHVATVDALEGYAVVAAVGTGREALETLARGSVDLVLLDIGLPDVGGLEVCRAVRATGTHVDVIAISAARDVDTVRGAVDLGIVEYVVKPFPARVLRDKLLRHRERVEERDRHTGSLTQPEVDRLLGRGREADPQDGLPKGLAPHTLEAIVTALRDAATSGRTAAGIAEDVGLSVRSARRYLAHLERIGCTRATPDYGGPGRPQLRFRWVDERHP